MSDGEKDPRPGYFDMRGFQDPAPWEPPDLSRREHDKVVPAQKWHPVAFRPAMIEAVLQGRKTEMRVLVKSDYDCVDRHQEVLILRSPSSVAVTYGRNEPHPITQVVHCPFGRVGDTLWIRRSLDSWDSTAAIAQMEIESIRVDRLAHIDEESALREGCVPEPGEGRKGKTARDAFGIFWRESHGDVFDDPKSPYTWYFNPLVWVISFRVTKLGAPWP